ncbi:Lactose permease [Apiospora phragmitis]|uniref:Lactose permease n=1 Tax=Apiospora phragmitis TaxID=2905665 RepID=A0ABR1UIZ1_9PEZI
MAHVNLRFYNVGWNALAYTYLVEILPYQQRAKEIAVEQLMLRFAVFFNTYVNPIELDWIGWKYYIVYCIWILVEIVTVSSEVGTDQSLTISDMFFPETYGQDTGRALFHV